MVEVATKDDLTTIHAQLGELKYKVEKMEAIVNKNPQVYGSFEEPCTCSCTKSDTPAFEWEVWWKGIESKELDRIVLYAETERDARDMITSLARKREVNVTNYEVRHNPKRK